MKSLGKLSGALMLALLTTTTTLAPADATPSEKRNAHALVIGHRGASGYRPEHTLESYRVAIRMGADYVEPDLVSTKDGVLVARHENLITGTTDVSSRPEFADRQTTKTIDGTAVTGWFTEDFTLAELKTLRAKERLPQVRPENTRYDGRFEVPTLDEVLDLVQQEERRTHRRIGVYPETKHPTYFSSIGLPMEKSLLASLRRHHMDKPGSRVFLQSFETGNLRQLNKMTRLPIIQLVDATGAPYDLRATGDPRTYRDLTTPKGLREISKYADGVGPNKELVLPRNSAGNTTVPSALVRDAHREHLVVHVFTLRRENQFMAQNFRRGTDPNAVGDLAAEVRAFLDAGVDGLFTDNPDVAVQARRRPEGPARRLMAQAPAARGSSPKSCTSKSTVRLAFASAATIALPMRPPRSKTAATPEAMPSELTRSSAASPISRLTGRRARVRLMSVLMCSTPLLPQFVTMLAASATLATDTNGEGSSSGMTGTAVCQVILRSPFWCSPNEVDQPTAELLNSGTRGSSDTAARSRGGGSNPSSGVQTSPGGGSLGWRNSPLARATGSPPCSRVTSTRHRRRPSRTTTVLVRHGSIRAARNRSTL